MLQAAQYGWIRYVLACLAGAVACMRRWLWFPPEQHPIVCQLGGSNPESLAAAAKIVVEYGYVWQGSWRGCYSNLASLVVPGLLVCKCSSAATYGCAHNILTFRRYDEINLNCGCPSDRVAGAGCFGAALMLRPELVASCCAAMQAAVPIPVTVKCRLGEPFACPQS